MQRAAARTEIPVRGIYVPSQQHMRLIGLIDVGAGDCRSDEGICDGASETALKVHNPFARDLRRLFFFYGPFDRTTNRFHGFYRETITGLAPYPVTVSGIFGMTQVMPDNAPIDLPSRLVPAERPGVTQFPASLEAEVDADLTAYCSCCELSALGFSYSTAGQEAYYWTDLPKLLASICPDNDEDGSCDLLAAGESGAAYEAVSCEDPTLVGDQDAVAFCDPSLARLRDIHQFSEALSLAMDALGASEGGDERALSIYDYLRGQIRFCEDLTADEKQDGMVCVSRTAAQCGLAVFRKVLLTERENLGTLNPGCSDDVSEEGVPCENPGYTLFCRRDLGPGCNYPPEENELLYALQQHGNYFREIAQTLKYEAGALQTDAFFTLYRNGAGDIEREEALSYKQLKLVEAWSTYEELRSYFYTPLATQVMLDWPMTAFAGLGQGWLDLMHNTSQDRLALVMEIADLKRRLLMTAGESDFIFAQDLMHYEYLTQVLMMEVQRRWQQPLGQFRYAGQGPDAFKTGDNILARLNLQRNPLGLHPNQVYFESSDPSLSNWRNYKRIVVSGPPGAGLLPDVEHSVQVAVENLRASLQETGALQEMVEDAKISYEEVVDSLCGPVVAAGSGGDGPITELCEPLSPEEREAAAACIGPDCPYEFVCADGATCGTVTQVLATLGGGTQAEALEDVACRLHTEQIVIDDGGTARMCVRGQVGSLLQEREELRLRRNQVERDIRVLQRRIKAQADYMQFLAKEHAELKNELDTYRKYAEGLAIATEITTAVAESAELVGDGVKDCWVIGGFAVGTGCVGAVAGTALTIAAVIAKWGVLPAIRAGERYNAYRSVLSCSTPRRGDIRRQNMALENLSLDAISLLNQYEQITQLLFNTTSASTTPSSSRNRLPSTTTPVSIASSTTWRTTSVAPPWVTCSCATST